MYRKRCPATEKRPLLCVPSFTHLTNRYDTREKVWPSCWWYRLLYLNTLCIQESKVIFEEIPSKDQIRVKTLNSSNIIYVTEVVSKMTDSVLISIKNCCKLNRNGPRSFVLIKWKTKFSRNPKFYLNFFVTVVFLMLHSINPLRSCTICGSNR